MAVKFFCPTIGLFLIMSAALFASNAVATQFTVGGSGQWTVPNNNNAMYSQWAEKMRFQIGDSLLFVYQSNGDSVLQVTKADYDSCNCASPMKKYTDGNTVVKFDRSGAYYFISGIKEHCQKNEKLHLVVMADRSGKSPAAASPPAPSPSHTPPAPPPAAVPSASPPAPSSWTPPPKHGAAAAVATGGIAGCVGALSGIAFLMIAS